MTFLGKRRLQKGIRVRVTLSLVLLASSLGFAVGQESGTEPAPSVHYVVLVSLSGFRWDYALRDGARNLLALGKSGVSAPEGILPVFPASTWPNAWTLVTGLYPGHHGIVADRFFNPVRSARFAGDDPDEALDSHWYAGVPLWVLAERQGMKTACIEWPGCATGADAAQRSGMQQAKGQASLDDKVKQIAAWLQLTAAERPHLISVYFPEADNAGRQFGPDAPETRTAVRQLDATIGKLRATLEATHLPVDLIVVSDHGMAKTEGDWITLDTLADLTGVSSEGTLLYCENDSDSERVYNALKKASANFIAYRLKNAPGDLHLAGNIRSGDPVLIATGAYALRAHRPEGSAADASPPRGIDGLNVRMVPEMKAIFFAAGPDIVVGKTVAPFENVNLYPWLAHLLGLTAPKNDGSLNLLSSTLRDGGDTGR